MFGIGFPELVVIAVVALIFVGPKKLPDLMRQAGKLFVHMRRTANDVRSTFDQVVREAEDDLRKQEAETLRALLTAQQAHDPKVLEAAATPSSTADSHPDHRLHPVDDHHHDSHHHHDHDGHQEPHDPHHSPAGTPAAAPPVVPESTLHDGPEGSVPFQPGQPAPAVANLASQPAPSGPTTPEGGAAKTTREP